MEKKGYDTLLDSLARLPKDLYWRFEHIGGGAELTKLKKQAETLGISDRIIWRGQQDQTAVLEAYRQADAFVLASRVTEDGDRDGLPNVIVEAASQGLACVSTRFSAIPELIDHGFSGLLVSPNDHEGLATVLKEVIKEPSLRLRLGNNAAQKVRSEFDFQPAIKRLTSIFEHNWPRMD